MSWCPKCRIEYRDGFTVCADCGAQLVDNLPAEPKPQKIDNSRPIQPVLLTHCPSTFDADATLALLRSFDIACFSQPDFGGQKTYTGMSMTGESIYVEHAQLERAKEIIQGFRSEWKSAQPEKINSVPEKPAPEPLAKKVFRAALLLMIFAYLVFFIYIQLT